MKHRLGRTTVTGLAAVAYAMLAASAYGVLNNGFETDWLYASQGGGDGSVITLNPVTGLQQGTLDATGAFWNTLTFAGTGANDARLFLANPASAPPATDVTIVEMNAAGTIVKSVLLKSLANFPASPVLVNASIGNMRYSIYHGTLFLSLNVDGPVGENSSSTGTTTLGPAVCYEIDLGLTQVLNTYLGPVIYDGGGFSDGSSPRVEINPNTGDLYMCGQRLNKSSNDFEGDLIVFDTSAGSTSTFTVLIDGTTYNPAGAGTGDDMWRNPSCPIYRGTNHPGDPRPTLMVINTGTVAAQNNVGMEFYLDEVDGSGNLVKRGDRYTCRRRPWNGQLDEYTGTVLATRVNNQQSPNHDAGLDQVFTDDVAFRPPFQAGVNNLFFDIGYGDVDSPGFSVSVVEPPGTQTTTSFAGGAATPNTFQFTFRNKGYRNPDNPALPSDTNVNRDVSYTVTKVPDDGTTAWLTLDKTAPAAPLAPDERNTITATIDAVSLAPGVHGVDLHFTDDAAPPNVHVRRVEVHVFECSWEVMPAPTTTAYVLASLAPMTYALEVRQTGGLPISYTVQEVAVAHARRHRRRGPRRRPDADRPLHRRLAQHRQHRLPAVRAFMRHADQRGPAPGPHHRGRQQPPHRPAARQRVPG